MVDSRIIDIDQAAEESIQKIISLLDEKHYFRARDELLKYNAVVIAEMLEEITEETDIDVYKRQQKREIPLGSNLIFCIELI